MNEEKVWYTSKGVIAPLVAAVLAMLSGLGVDVGIGSEEATQVVLAVGSAVAAIIGTYGRVVANAKITGRRD